MPLNDAGIVRLLPVTDVPAEGYVMARIGEYNVLVCRVGGEVSIIEDRCSHMSKPLNGGRMIGGRITCPEHGAEFDVRSGVAVCLPASRRLRRFEARVSNGFIEARTEPLPDDPPPTFRPFGI